MGNVSLKVLEFFVKNRIRTLDFWGIGTLPPFDRPHHLKSRVPPWVLCLLCVKLYTLFLLSTNI